MASKKSSSRVRKVAVRRVAGRSSAAVALLNEPIDQVVTPWLLVALLVITAVFVVLQYVLA